MVFWRTISFLKTTIPLIAPLAIIMPLGLAIGQQYLIPMNRIRTYNYAVITGAIISIVTNMVLIPVIGIYGAIIATLLAEFCVTIIRFKSFKKETSIVIDFRNILKYFIAGIVMFICTSNITSSMPSKFSTTIIQILIGGGIYLIITLFLKVNPIYRFVKERKF